MENNNPNPIKEYYIAYFDILRYKAFDEVSELFEDMKYIRSERIKTSGRPSTRYKINPFIRGF